MGALEFGLLVKALERLTHINPAWPNAVKRSAERLHHQPDFRFEVGRVELLRQLGFTYKDMEREDDCFIAVVDARCRYKAPVHYDDEVVVRTYLKNIREKLIHFGYELVRAETGELLAEGETTHIVANSQMQPRALPEKYLKVFRAAIGK